MNKSELVAAIAERTEQPKSTVAEIIDAFQETIVNGVAEGTKISIPGFLTFEKGHRNERQGKNPQTGAVLTIPAADVPKVKIGKAFKDVVNS